MVALDELKGLFQPKPFWERTPHVFAKSVQASVRGISLITESIKTQ